MSSTASCAACGSEVDAGARFCAGCGSDVTGQQGGVATQYVKPSSAQQAEDQLLETLRSATLGDYEVLTQLGQGGMATVYLAHDISLDRKVAIKVMNPALVSGEGMVERFKLEARTSAGLSHAHIIPIYAVKEMDDLLFFVMKFIDGRPLDSIIKEAAPLPIPMVRAVIAKVAEALGYAHRRGVVHRDIKPANIMIDAEGAPIVTDFGIAKVADQQGLTMTGATIGTPTYMSPEQCNALAITGASDQYSLGVMAYEMLTGRPLFDGDSVMTIMFKHVHDEPPAPDEFGSEVPADLGGAITKMLQKKPEDRWETMEAALPSISGGQTAYDDSARTALIEFAKHSENRDILARVSTPRSPIPLSATGAPIDSAETVRFSSGVVTGAAPGRTVVTAPKKSRKGLWLGLGGLVVVGAVAAAVVLGPMSGGQTAQTTQPVAIGDLQQPAANPNAAATTDPTSEPALPTGQIDSAPTAAVDNQSVRPAAVQSVRIVSPPASILAGQSVTLRATVTDANGAAVNRRVSWQSSNLGTAQIGASGVVQAIAPGTTTISATVDGRSDDVLLTVSAIPVARVTVAPTRRTLEVGDTVQLNATPADQSGTALQNRPVNWSSSSNAIATVSATGLVRAVAAGTATITATSEARTATASVTVNAPVVAVDHHVLIEQTIQDYADALEAKDIDAVRVVYPGLPSDREKQLRDALPAMNDLRVRLSLGSIDIDGNRAFVEVTGQWLFNAGGNRELPADNQYVLARRGARWVITDIR